MQLAKGENIVKEWNYGSTKVGKEVKELSLTVTNKRIVHTQKSALEVSKTELSVNDVNGVTGSFKTTSSTSAIVKIVIGAVLLVLGIILIIAGMSSFGIVAIVPSIPLLIWGIYEIVKKPLVFTLILYCPNKQTPSDLFTFGMMKGAFKKKKASTIVKLAVNKEVAYDMVDTIGSLILDIQSQNETVA